VKCVRGENKCNKFLDKLAAKSIQIKRNKNALVLETYAKTLFEGLYLE